MANDPFDVTGGNPDFWNNLSRFGMATMAASAQPGIGTLPAIGQGGMAAMEAARQNQLSNAQIQNIKAEAQSRQLNNMLIPYQMNLMQMQAKALDPSAWMGDNTEQAPQKPAGGPSTSWSPVAGGAMPLSVRNNNPGNMKDPTTGQFQNFMTPQAGMQAMQDDLTAKISGKSVAMGGKQPTLSNIISTWAPPSENDTGNYINFVSNKTGIKPDQILTQNDIPTVMGAMTQMEGGQKANQYFNNQNRDYASQIKPTPREQRMMAAKVINPGIAEAGQKEYEARIAPIKAAQEAQAKLPYEEAGARAKKQQEQLEDAAEEVNKVANSAVQSNFIVDQMERESQSWTPNKFADWEGNYRSYAQAMRQTLGMPEDKELNEKLGDWQAFNKNANELVRQATRETSTRAALQEMLLIQKALPSDVMSKEGLHSMFGQIRAVNDYKIAKQTAQQNWRDTHGGDLKGFETTFNKDITPTAFFINRMSPDEFRVFASRMQATDGGKDMLKRVLGQMQTAKSNGYFD